MGHNVLSKDEFIIDVCYFDSCLNLSKGLYTKGLMKVFLRIFLFMMNFVAHVSIVRLCWCWFKYSRTTKILTFRLTVEIGNLSQCTALTLTASSCFLLTLLELVSITPCLDCRKTPKILLKMTILPTKAAFWSILFCGSIFAKILLEEVLKCDYNIWKIFPTFSYSSNRMGSVLTSITVHNPLHL